MILPERGTRIDGFEVTAPVWVGRQAAVVQARAGDGSFASLKLAFTSVGEQLVEHEERVLRALDADAAWAPRALGGGSAGEWRWRAASWMPGITVRGAAEEMRGEGPAGGLLPLCSQIARSFARLHERGVVHGQVHPRHVLVDGDRGIALIDFSVAAAGEERPPAHRLEARFGSLGAPEQAKALLAGGDVVPSAEAEQYSVAALLYLLVTGKMYARLRLERASLASDIADATRVPFSEHGVAAFPDLEAVLGRALQKDPDRRYASTGDLAEALEALSRKAGARRPARLPAASALASALETFKRQAYSDDAIAGAVAPTCSINFGAAGVAYALTRLGSVTGDAVALAQAERWLSAAERMSGAVDAFDDGDELTPETIGTVSPFHTASGIPTARAFLSRATGDHVREQAALEEFCRATSAPCANLDLTLGRSSVLLVRCDPARGRGSRVAGHSATLRLRRRALRGHLAGRSQDVAALPRHRPRLGGSRLRDHAVVARPGCRSSGGGAPGTRHARRPRRAMAAGRALAGQPAKRPESRSVLARLVPRQRRLRLPLGPRGGDVW